MSALRKAGVWLGLIEDEDDEAYEDRAYRDNEYGDGRARGRGEESFRVRARDRGRDRDGRRFGGGSGDFADEFAEEEDPGVTTSHGSLADRLARRRAQRDGEASVRSITRDSTVTYPTRDSLALTPQTESSTESAPEPEPEPERRYQITTLHPTTFREARTIGEHFREGTPVIMNLTEMDEADARRLVDFGAGLVFGLRGTMDRVTNRVFLLTPANVQVTAEDRAKIAEGEFLNYR